MGVAALLLRSPVMRDNTAVPRQTQIGWLAVGCTGLAASSNDIGVSSFLSMAPSEAKGRLYKVITCPQMLFQRFSRQYTRGFAELLKPLYMHVIPTHAGHPRLAVAKSPHLNQRCV